MISSLEGSYNGEGWRSTPDKPFRLKMVGTGPGGKGKRTVPFNSCSAHYFDLANGLIAYGWYGQGTRISRHEGPDESDPGRLLRARSGNVWAS